MNKYFEVSVELVTNVDKSGKTKKRKEIFLVDAMTVTEAEARVIKDFVTAKVSLEYKVVGAKESKIIQVIE